MTKINKGSGVLPGLPTNYADRLEMTTEGKTLSMAEWTRLSADYFYPDACGSRTVRAPAVHFNHLNRRTPGQAARKQLLLAAPRAPSSSSDPSLGPLRPSLRSPSPCSRSSPSSCSSCCGSSSSTGPSCCCSSSSSSSTSSTPLSQSPNPSVFPSTISLPASSSSSTLRSVPRGGCEGRGGGGGQAAPRTLGGTGGDGRMPTTKTTQRLVTELPSGAAAAAAGLEDRDKGGNSHPPSTTASVSEREVAGSEPSEVAPLVSSSAASRQKVSGKTKTHGQQRSCQPVQLMFPPQESTVRRDKAMTTVLEALQTLGRELEERTSSGDEGEEEEEVGNGLFIISGVNYDNYLNRLPPQVFREASQKDGNNGGGGYLGDARTSRGVLDILVLQERVGLVLIQVKSVGGNQGEWQASDNDIETALRSVLHKVKEKTHELKANFGRELLDPGSGNEPYHVLALPFIPRRLYHKLCEDDPDLQDCFDVKVICKENLEDTAACPGWIIHRDVDFVSSPQPAPLAGDTAQSSLYLWWRKHLPHTSPRITVDKIKEIVGRICGFFSTFTAQPDTKCRSEVRTLGHSVSETAARFSEPCLTIAQYNVLQLQDPYVVLTGPPGSGKTLILALKAAQWLDQENDEGDAENHRHVIVVGLRRGSTMTTTTAASASTAQQQQQQQQQRLPPSARTLQEAIDQRASGSGREGFLLSVTYPLDAIPLGDIEREVVKTVDVLIKEIQDAKGSAEEEVSSGVNEVVQADQLDDGDTQAKKMVKEKAEAVTTDISCGDPAESRDNSLLRLRAGAEEAAEKDFLKSVTFHKEEKTSVIFQDDREQGSRLKMRTKADAYIVPEGSCESSSPVGDSDVDLHGQPGDELKHLFHFVVSDADPNDEKIDHLLQALVKHPQARSVWWSASEPPGTTQGGAWSLCRVEEMDRVTRRPPRVQRVLKDLERRDRWKEAYVSCSAEAGLPTDGPPVVCIQHTTHHYHAQETCQARNYDVTSCAKESERLEQPQTKRGRGGKRLVTAGMTSSIAHPHSLFWCGACAEAITDIISRLITDSVNPKLSPFYVGSTKFMKDRSKNKFGTAITPRDILIVTNSSRVQGEETRSADADADLPPEAEATAEEETKEDKSYDLVNSTLVRQIRSRIPLKVLTSRADCDEEKVVFPKNYAVLTDASNVRGLERTVVIYVAQDCVTMTVSSLPERYKADSLIQTCSRAPHKNEETGISWPYEAASSSFRSSKHVTIEQPTNKEETDSISVRSVSSADSSDSLNSIESQSSDKQTEWAPADGSSGSNHSPYVLDIPATASVDTPTVEDRSVKIALDRDTAVLSGANVRRGITEDAEEVHNNNSAVIDRAGHSGHPGEKPVAAAVTERDSPEMKSHIREDPDGKPSALPEDAPLPRWVKHKKDLTDKREAARDRFRQELQLEEAEEADDGSRPGRKPALRWSSAPRCLDDLLSGLSDVNRRGLYAAASCCLSQLVILTK